MRHNSIPALCLALPMSLASAQSTQPAPTPSRPADEAAATSQPAAVDMPLDETKKREYDLAMTAARKREISGAGTLRQELRVALNSVAVRRNDATPGPAAAPQPAVDPQPGVPTDAKRRKQPTKYDPLVVPPPSAQAGAGAQPPAARTRGNATPVSQEQAMIAQQLRQVEAMQRLYATCLDYEVNRQFGQSAKAEASARYADRIRRTINIGPQMPEFHRMLPIERTALAEYVKVRPNPEASSKPAGK